MKTTRELGRFLFDNGLRMRVDFLRRGFKVTLLAPLRPAAVGVADEFPDAVDAALMTLARQKHAEEAS